MQTPREVADWVQVEVHKACTHKLGVLPDRNMVCEHLRSAITLPITSAEKAALVEILAFDYCTQYEGDLNGFVKQNLGLISDFALSRITEFWGIAVWNGSVHTSSFAQSVLTMEMCLRSGYIKSWEIVSYRDGNLDCNFELAYPWGRIPLEIQSTNVKPVS